MKGTIDLHIDLAQDGSGWSLNQENDTRSACIKRTPDDTPKGAAYTVIVPFENHEEREAYRANMETCTHGYNGVKIPNVKERYMEER